MPPEEKKVIVNDDSAFYKTVVTLIKQKGQTLEVTLMDEKGIKYEKSVLGLDNPQMGCIDGIFATRTMAVGSGGVEGSYGLARAVEKNFGKLSDCSLQITI